MLRGKLSIIGSGNMGEAFMAGLLLKELVRPEQMLAIGPREERGAELHQRYGVRTSTSNLAALESDVICLCVKPQAMPAVLEELKGKVPGGCLVISIAAGIPLGALFAGLGYSTIVRAMPNTPARIGRGITVWAHSPFVDEEEHQLAATILGAIGRAEYFEDEKYVDMATALFGTGKAMVDLFMEAMTDAGVDIGFPRRIAESLIIDLVLGSGEYAKTSGKHLAELRNEVTSPGGTTTKALFTLERDGFRTAIYNAVRAAHERSLQMGN